MSDCAREPDGSDVFDRLYKAVMYDPIRELVADKDLAGRIRAKQLDSITRTMPLMMLANMVNVVVTFWVFRGSISGFGLEIWAAAMIFFILLNLWSLRSWDKRDKPPKSVRSTGPAVKNAAVLASLWGALPVMFFSGASTAQMVFLTCIMGGMMGSGTMALSIIPSAATVFCFFCGLGAAYVLIAAGEPVFLACLVLLGTYAVGITRLAHEHGRRFVKRYMDEQSIEEQRSTISVLLKDFENNSSDWMWQTDRNGFIIDPSTRFCESVGVGPDVLKGKAFHEFVSLPQDKNSSELTVMPLAKRLLLDGAFRDHILQVNTSLGPQWWNLTGKPIYDEDGQSQGFRGTAANVNDWKNAQDRLNNLARFDQVTGVSNRNHFTEVLTAACKEFNNAPVIHPDGMNEEFALIFIDLDKLKLINDSLGHATGDALLREVSSRLQSLLHKYDTVSRFGGDKFAVLHRSGVNFESSKSLAKDILFQLERPFLLQGHTVSITGSIGVAFSRARPVGAEELMRNADIALFKAKEQGGGAFEVFQLGMDAVLQQRRELEMDLRNALRGGEFELHYQPLASVETEIVSTYEALIRWNHPRRGQLLPDEFIPLAEETGLINDIGDWVLEQACSDAKTWSTPHRVAVNVSARQILAQRLLMQVMETLEKTKLPAERLELEVTESVLIENPERTRKLFVELRKLGVGISLDDFGTGYSSLSYLVRFPFDKVKIDKTFIQAAEQSEEDLAIIRSILGLAGNLGIRTTAEGIEKKSQLEIVRQEGCDEMQGFLIEKPRPMSEIEALTGAKATNKNKAA